MVIQTVMMVMVTTVGLVVVVAILLRKTAFRYSAHNSIMVAKKTVMLQYAPHISIARNICSHKSGPDKRHFIL